MKLKENEFNEKITYNIKGGDKYGKGLIIDEETNESPYFEGVFRFNPSIRTINFVDKKTKENKTFDVIEAVVKPTNPELFDNIVVDDYGTIKITLPDCKSIREAFEDYDSVPKKVGNMTVNEIKGLQNFAFKINIIEFTMKIKEQDVTKTKYNFEIGEEVPYEAEEKSNADDVEVEGYDFPQDKVLEVQKAFDEGKVKADQKININGVDTTVSEVLGLN